jgi:hypothetical protein
VMDKFWNYKGYIRSGKHRIGILCLECVNNSGNAQIGPGPRGSSRL